MDSSGALFDGGAYDGGTVFELLAHDTWTETAFHDFCAQTNCTDGRFPTGRLTMDSSGNLYGTTAEGGAGPDASCGGYGYCWRGALPRASPGGVTGIFKFFLAHHIWQRAAPPRHG